MTHRPYSRDTESRRKVSDAVELNWSRTPCHRLRLVILSIETGPPSDGGRRQSGWPGGLPCMMLKAGRRPSNMQESRLDLTNRRKGRRVLTFVGPLPSAERAIYCCGAPDRSLPIRSPRLLDCRRENVNKRPPLAITFTAPPPCSQVKMSILNTRFKRCAHVVETWHADAGSSLVCALHWPRRAGVTCSRNRWFGANTT